jgi:site-specific DNA recombinase
MERPALQRLMADIAKGLIAAVVVYKVDRLTRSLADFAKMVEVFDARGVSFVAVTQQFNTTTSMGRLTLNVLLSFAQFEREVTGERIRDKIAASKRKGIWMGGLVPLGYEVRDRQLVINEAEAATVRRIFTRYCELGSVRLLKEELDRNGVRSKIRVSTDGVESGGQAFSRGALYTLLTKLRSSWHSLGFAAVAGVGVFIVVNLFTFAAKVLSIQSGGPLKRRAATAATTAVKTFKGCLNSDSSQA